MTRTSALIETLPPVRRLALTYAPAAAREATLGLFAFDARLADVVRSASEPMLAQIRLAWWRETLGSGPDNWPEGEPLLLALKPWAAQGQVLAQLADAWEMMTSEGHIAATEIKALAKARGTAFAALGSLLGTDGDAAAVTGYEWALADIASGLSRPEERDQALALARECEWKARRLPRALRPLAVLHGLAVRSVRKGVPIQELRGSALVSAMRIGLLGR